MEVVSSGDEVEHIPSHELSLQERLSNLAGVPLPPQPQQPSPQQPQQQPQHHSHHNQQGM